MSENITHTAVVDDCRRLALHAESICAAFKQALRAHPDAARLGGVTRHGDRHTVDLLEAYRRALPAGSNRDRLLEKLAFVLGWLCHRAADRQMKPIWRKLLPDEQPGQSPTECSIYHDVFVLREVYEHARGQPYALLYPAPASAPAEWESLLWAAWQRMLIAIHTLIPDDDAVDGWLDKLLDRYQRLGVDLSRYANALAGPDPDKLKRYVEDVNFYDRRDPIIRLARALAAGRRPPVPLAEAVDRARRQSHYAQALRRGFLYIEAAGDYFAGRMDRSELARRLDIGRPEVE